MQGQLQAQASPAGKAHGLCDSCETVSHCRRNGCIPLTPLDQYPLRSMAEVAARKHLLEAVAKLQQVQRAAEAADYGDQFTGSVDEAIKQIEYTLGMLA